MGKNSQVEIVAAADRQFLNLFRFNGRGEGGLRWIDDRRLVRYRDRIRGGPRRQIDVEASDLTDGEHDPGVPVRRKARLLDAHFISADHKLARAEKALLIGLHCASLVGLYVAQLDFRAGNDGATTVGERTLQGRGDLRDLGCGRGGQQQSQGQREKQIKTFEDILTFINSICVKDLTASLPVIGQSVGDMAA